VKSAESAGRRFRGTGAIDQGLAGDGATVVFNYARNSEAAARVERAVRETGSRAYAVRIDLARSGAVDELMATAAEQLDGWWRVQQSCRMTET
jgi:3-oxoacyl-[acyl-carrier protein] reductase